MKNTSTIIDTMFANDNFSQWLGIERLEEEKGYCKLRMTITNIMCNGFGIAHGGIAYSFADSALAFAANSNGRLAVSVETSISHMRPLSEGENIIAIARELSLNTNIGVYEVRIEKEDGELAALFKGTVYLKKQQWQL